LKILALDSTTRAGSVALLDDERIVAEQHGDAARTHAERLPGELIALLETRGLKLPGIDLFAVASGPGSFTGLRVGIATLQGFALVGGRPIAGISALEALAHAGSTALATGARVGAWMDAHRRDVFTALYEVTNGQTIDRLVEIEGPRVGDPAETLERWRRAGWMPFLFVGDGAAMYADTIASGAGNGVRVESAPALAATIGRLALWRARAGSASGPAAIQPLYVRRPDAELARDRAQAGTSDRR
jgi:tRNA threonylcarbamoyladenosine biosynthesis protein TsaB